MMETRNWAEGHVRDNEEGRMTNGKYEPNQNEHDDEEEDEYDWD